MDSLAGTLAADPIKLSVQAGRVGQAQATYREKYERLVEKLNFNDVKQKLCGPVSIELVTQHAFIK